MTKKILSFLICLFIMCSSGYADKIDTDMGETEIFHADSFNMYVKPKLPVRMTKSRNASTTGDIEGAKAAMKEAMLNYRSSFSCSSYNISVETVINIFRSLWYEEPDLFYANFHESNFTITSTTNWDYYTGNPYTKKATKFTIPYRFSQAVAEEKKALIQKECNKILNGISADMNDVEKVLAVHDYFAIQYEYNYPASIAPESQYYNYADAYSMDGLFISKTAVCQGFTLGYMYVLGFLGIESVFVPSEYMHHAWNLVRIGNNWYHVDVTWDVYYNQYAGWCFHDFVLLSDEAISKTRQHHKVDIHDGWVVEYEALDTTYDDYFWEYITSGIFYADGYWYYVSYDDDEHDCSYLDVVCKRNIATGKEEFIIWMDDYDYWLYNDEYLMPCSCKLFLHNSRIYYTTPMEIRSADLDGKDIKTECTPDIDGDFTYVCGLMKDGKNARYCVMKMSDNPRYTFDYDDTFKLEEMVNLTYSDDNTVAITLDESITEGTLFAAVYSDDKSICIPVVIQRVEGSSHYSFSLKELQYPNLKIMVFDNNLRPLLEPCAEFKLNITSD